MLVEELLERLLLVAGDGLTCCRAVEMGWRRSHGAVPGDEEGIPEAVDDWTFKVRHHFGIVIILDLELARRYR